MLVRIRNMHGHAPNHTQLSSCLLECWRPHSQNANEEGHYSLLLVAVNGGGVILMVVDEFLAIFIAL